MGLRVSRNTKKSAMGLQVSCNTKKSARNLSVDWDSIDDNLLELIAKRLDVMDYIRFRSVCKTWRSISIDTHGCLIPWLIMGCDRVDGRLFYFSFTDHKSHSIAVPALKENKNLELGVVSCQGWLLLEGQHDSYAISLLNPLTGAHVHLPEVPKDLFTRRIQYNMHFDPLRPEATMEYVEIQYLIHRMAMSSNPSSNTDCTIVVISAVGKALVSLRMGVDGSSWNSMNNQSKYEDVAFCYQSFLAVDCFGEVSIFSGTDLNKLRTIVGSPAMLPTIAADWRFSALSTQAIMLFRKVSDHEGYISFKDKKLPFYKTKRISLHIIMGDCTGGSGLIKHFSVKLRNSLYFYGMPSPRYKFISSVNSTLHCCTYIAGEHGEVPDDDSFVYYITMPKAYDINDATLRPLFCPFGKNLISFWHMPQPF